MLIVLMYHRVSHTHACLQTQEQALSVFAQHLRMLSQSYPIVLPGQKLVKNRINICLSFDDAYFDFYQTVFPLLKIMQIPALLAIPSGLILDKASMAVETRLQVPYREALNAYLRQESLCSWDEIRHMLASKLIMPASHGLRHKHISLENIQEEVVHSKKLLEKNTGQEINTFVYPYGHMKRPVHQIVKQHYRYSMRIGSALNMSWDNCHQVIYRINADNFWLQNKQMMGLGHRLNLFLRFLSNSLRFK